MLLKAEFEVNISFLEPSIEAMIHSAEELMISQKLQDLFYMVLMAGNFLNSVSIKTSFVYLLNSSKTTFWCTRTT